MVSLAAVNDDGQASKEVKSSRVNFGAKIKFRSSGSEQNLFFHLLLKLIDHGFRDDEPKLGVTNTGLEYIKVKNLGHFTSWSRSTYNRANCTKFKSHKYHKSHKSTVIV